MDQNLVKEVAKLLSIGQFIKIGLLLLVTWGIVRGLKALENRLSKRFNRYRLQIARLFPFIRLFVWLLVLGFILFRIIRPSESVALAVLASSGTPGYSMTRVPSGTGRVHPGNSSGSEHADAPSSRTAIATRVLALILAIDTAVSAPVQGDESRPLPAVGREPSAIRCSLLDTPRLSKPAAFGAREGIAELSAHSVGEP